MPNGTWHLHLSIAEEKKYLAYPHVWNWKMVTSKSMGWLGSDVEGELGGAREIWTETEKKTDERETARFG